MQRGTAVTTRSEPATSISLSEAMGSYRRAITNKAFERAQRMTWRLLAAGAIDVSAMTHLAEHLFGAGTHGPARELARIAATIEPSLVRPYRLVLASAAEMSCFAGHRIGGWAFAIDPSDAAAPMLAGPLARLGGYHQASLGHFRRAAEARPTSATIWINIAGQFAALGDPARATVAARRATCLQPGYAGALFAAGEAAAATFNHAATTTLYDRVLKVAPYHAVALQNRGHAQRRRGLLEQASDDYRRALVLAPAQPSALIALAQLTLPGGDVPRVRLLFQRATMVEPRNPEAGFFGALTDLRIGRFDEGWSGYSWFGALAFPRRTRQERLPRWPTREPNPTGLLVWNDQFGLGEEVMYLSALTELTARTDELTLACSPKLKALITRSFPKVKVTSPDAVAATDPALGGRPAEAPLLAAITELRRDFRDFPRHSGYLKADPIQVTELKERYRDPTGRPLIGISWSSPLGFQGPRKSVPLTLWGPVFQALDARFISLQYHADIEEIDAARARHGVDILVDEDLDTFDDLDAHAAQIAAMDRVISISGIAAHLAGALGKSVDLLFPSEIVLLWYWFHGRADSPWYPSMTIHRPSADGDKEGLMAAVARHLIAKKPSDAAPG